MTRQGQAGKLGVWEGAGLKEGSVAVLLRTRVSVGQIQVKGTSRARRGR